ncbi:MAG: Mut7-C RNAse domain-containing protein [Thermovirgaceae bacterium]
MPVWLVFHGDLVDLLNKNTDPGSVRELFRTAPVKDLVESQGIPHTEAGSIVTAEGGEKAFDYTPGSGETLHVYPHKPPVDVTKGSLLFPHPFGEIRFIVDVNVGRLAKLLRIAGFDTLYNQKWEDSEIAEKAREEERILLTRDRELLKRNAVIRGRLIRSPDPWDQFGEVVTFFGLREKIDLFSRCPKCNGPLKTVDKEEIIDQLEPLTRLMYDTFTRCPGCGQIYWCGSHHSRIREKMAASLSRACPSNGRR